MSFHKLYTEAIHRVLNKIWIPPSNVNIARQNMPQISTEQMKHYIEWLQDGRVSVELTTVNGVDLQPTQLDINTEKVLSLIGDQPEKLDKPIIISNDNYVVDGHHRWIAKLNMSNDKNYVPISAYQVDLKLKDLLRKTMLYPNVFYKDIDGNVKHAPEGGLWL